MKTLEIILRIFDYIFTTLLQKKAQDERNKIEEHPASWFSEHFNGGMPSNTSSKADKTDPSGNTKG